MAISNIPVINGPSFGGVIYGLNLEVNYSSEPSKLTLDIISKDGNYTTPALNSSAQVSFGSFTFNGIIWGYSFKESSQEKTLQVEIIDNSIILDRYYVLLWKRGIFNNLGNRTILTKKIDLSDQTTLVPVKAGFAEIKFEEKSLGFEFINRDTYTAFGKNGNILYVGREKFSDSPCDIPDTNYLLSDLASVSPVPINFTAPKNYSATHEGTLREVLQTWSADCGFDFYWDFSANTIKYYQVDQGISTVPDITHSKIIEKSKSSSLEGTFSQYALAYTAYPKEAIKSLSQSAQIIFTTTLNSFPISYFLNKNNTLQSVYFPTSDEASGDDPDASQKNLWGGRTKDDFLSAAFLGYICEQLRDIYIFTMPSIPWWVTGLQIYDPKSKATSTTALTDQDKKDFIQALKDANCLEDLKDMESVDGVDLPNYNIYFCDKNDDINGKWKELEQEILRSYGSVYRLGPRSGSYFYCTSTTIIQVDISIDPDSSDIEPKTSIFKGKRVFKRGGSMSHDQNSAMVALGLDKEDFLSALKKVEPRLIDLVSSGIKSKKYTQTKATNVIFVPNITLYKKYIKSIDVNIAKGFNNLEATVFDVEQSETQKTCSPFDDNLKQNSCIGAKEEAEEKQMKKLSTVTSDDSSPSSGLTNRYAQGASISINGKSLKIYAPSDSPYQSVCSYNYSTQKISTSQNDQKIFFNGNGGTANNVAKIDVLFDNVTDSLTDEFSKQRVGGIPTAKSISNTNPKVDITYVFAGEPVGLTLSPSKGLNKLDVSYSSDGFKTTVGFSTRPEQRTEVNTFLRKIQSQFNRVTFAAS